MGGWAPRWRRALLERTAQVRAVVRRAGSAHSLEGVTEHGRGRRRCPLSEGSGDCPDTRNATDAAPAQVGGLTTGLVRPSARGVLQRATAGRRTANPGALRSPVAAAASTPAPRAEG
jgi:hypothetical protein